MYVAFCFGKKLTILKATNPTFVGFVFFFLLGHGTLLVTLEEQPSLSSSLPPPWSKF